MINIVLYQPEIPQNTGNIARLCACTGANLILVGKLGFSLSDKHTKRSGLDYWEQVNIEKVLTFEEVHKNAPKEANFYYFSTKGARKYTEVNYKSGDYLVFGSEGKGLPKDIMELAGKNLVTLPMIKDTRSLNLSNTVAVGVYETIRQGVLLCTN